MQQRQQQQQQQRQPLFPPPPPQVGSTRRPLDFLREQTLGRYQASKSNSSFLSKKEFLFERTNSFSRANGLPLRRPSSKAEKDLRLTLAISHVPLLA